MTILEAIAQLRRVKPNQYGDAELVRWLSDLDGLIWREIMSWHEGLPEDGPPERYDPVTDGERALLAPEPYSGVYVAYLGAQVDYNNAEFERYNNSVGLYNAALSAFADHYNRTRAPAQGAYVEV